MKWSSFSCFFGPAFRQMVIAYYWCPKSGQVHLDIYCIWYSRIFSKVECVLILPDFQDHLPGDESNKKLQLVNCVQ